MTAESPVKRTLDDLTRNEQLDQLADALHRVARTVASGPLGALLEGRRLTGAPLHPALVHFPIGGAFGAAVLATAGRDRAAGLLTCASLLSAAPTALAGLRDAGDIQERPEQRIAAVHALAASTGTALLAGGLAGRGSTRTWLLWAALGAYGVAGLLGGHLVYGSDE